VHVVHVVSRFYPDAGGGERFVGGLIRSLSTLGVRSRVVCFGPSPAESVWNGVPVHRLAESTVSSADSEEHTCFGDRRVAADFGATLDADRPDLVHVHTRTRETAELAREASGRAIPAVFTYHHPAATCLRGDLQRFGCEACDGRLDAQRCSACLWHSKGVPQVAATALAALPLASRAAAALTTGRLRTAFRIPHVTTLLHRQIRAFFREFAHCIALCTWSHDLIVATGISPDRVTVVRPGVVDEPVPSQPSVTPSAKATGAPRLVYLGRFHPAKGIHVVIEALRESSLRLTLDVHGVVVDAEGENYLQDLRRLASDDPRIRFLGPLAEDLAIPTLRAYDALVVPSIGLETGPLVAFEAFAAGIPVIGSRIGAVDEIVADSVNGLLLPPGDARAWRQALNSLEHEPHALARLRAAVVAPRTMAEVARETLDIYVRARSGRSATSAAAAPEATRL
jgi:glycosyltransferase involved in cell wall biosynthesis